MAGGPVQEFEWDDGQGGQGQMALASTLITLVLLLVIGFVVWHRSDSRASIAALLPGAEGEGTSVAAVEPAPPRNVYAGPQTLGIDADVWIAYSSSNPPRVYFVATTDAATEVLNRVAEENRLRFANGEPEFNAQVVVVGSDDHAIAYAGSLQDSDAIRVELGAPPFEIIDLRTSGTVAQSAITCSGDGMTTATPSGGMAEWYCAQTMEQPQGAAPSPAHAGTGELITVYRVTEPADTGLIYERYLRPNEVALRVGTTEEEIRADAMLRELTLRVGDGNVTVIDLRQSTSVDRATSGEPSGHASHQPLDCSLREPPCLNR
jgi:hypothetical protein